MKNNGFTIWLTGYSGAGKTTISTELKKELITNNIPCEILDGDLLRETLSKGLSFSREDRDTNVMRIGFVAKLLNQHGVCTIVSSISPYRQTREAVRKSIGNFVEVFVRCSLEECSRRDVKGLYRKASAGQIANFTGIDDPYEEPHYPEIICDTEIETLQESVNKILTVLLESRYLVFESHFGGKVNL